MADDDDIDEVEMQDLLEEEGSSLPTLRGEGTSNDTDEFLGASPTSSGVTRLATSMQATDLSDSVSVSHHSEASSFAGEGAPPADEPDEQPKLPSTEDHEWAENVTDQLKGSFMLKGKNLQQFTSAVASMAMIHRERGSGQELTVNQLIALVERLGEKKAKPVS